MSDNSIRKILGESASNKTPENPVENDEYQAFSYGRIGNRPQLMIVFRKADGYCEGYPYSLLTKISSGNPDQGFVIEFGNRKVTITGNNLERLFRFVCDCKSTELVESHNQIAFQQPSAYPILTSIQFA